MLDTIPKSVFSEALNTNFRAQATGDSIIELELVEVTEGVSLPHNERFSVIFRAPLNIAPVQGIYRIEHEKIGVLDLFLVPIRMDEKDLYFEAVFNRLLKQGE